MPPPWQMQANEIYPLLEENQIVLNISVFICKALCSFGSGYQRVCLKVQGEEHGWWIDSVKKGLDLFCVGTRGGRPAQDLDMEDAHLFFPYATCSQQCYPGASTKT